VSVNVDESKVRINAYTALEGRRLSGHGVSVAFEILTENGETDTILAAVETIAESPTELADAMVDAVNADPSMLKEMEELGVDLQELAESVSVTSPETKRISIPKDKLPTGFKIPPQRTKEERDWFSAALALMIGGPVIACVVGYRCYQKSKLQRSKSKEAAASGPHSAYKMESVSAPVPSASAKFRSGAPPVAKAPPASKSPVLSREGTMSREGTYESTYEEVDSE
jgi:hypothetical protein